MVIFTTFFMIQCLKLNINEKSNSFKVVQIIRPSWNSLQNIEKPQTCFQLQYYQLSWETWENEMIPENWKYKILFPV